MFLCVKCSALLGRLVFSLIHHPLPNADNAVNGVPSCANGVFNNEVLRDTFGFTGMIVSDCSAVYGIEKSHNYTHNADDTMRAALRGGTDLNCGTYYGQNAMAALNNSAIIIDDIDKAVRRVFSQFYQVGLGEHPVPWSDLAEEDIDSDDSREMALDAARQVNTGSFWHSMHEISVVPQFFSQVFAPGHGLASQ